MNTPNLLTDRDLDTVVGGRFDNRVIKADRNPQDGVPGSGGDKSMLIGFGLGIGIGAGLTLMAEGILGLA